MNSEIDITQEIKHADFTGKEGRCLLSHRDEIIDRYVTYELSEEAREAFDEHCFNCDVCFQALKHREEVVQLIKNEGRTIFAEFIAGRRAGFSLQILIEKMLHPGRLQPVEWAFAAIVVLVLVAGGYLMFKSTPQSDLLASIQYDDQVPYAFTPQFGTSLRTPSEAREGGLNLDQFYNRFLAAMAEYRNLNYERAVDLLAPLQPYAQQLLAKAVNDTLIMLTRDYYFYSGASSMALARSHRIQLDAAERQRYLETAIELLSHSIGLIKEHRLPEADRDHYFLGLAYGLAENVDSAVIQLGNVKPESEFYERSQTLLDQWAQ